MILADLNLSERTALDFYLEPEDPSIYRDAYGSDLGIVVFEVPGPETYFGSRQLTVSVDAEFSFSSKSPEQPG